jgi:hypothetical protein
MGDCGESAATKFKISRESQDAHAIESYKRAARAWADGVYDAEVAPVTVTIKGRKGPIVKEDEEYKRVIFEKVPTLKPSFKEDGSITAANSSPLSDGASALILMSAEKAKDLGIRPLARVVCMLRLWHGRNLLIDELLSFLRCWCQSHRLPRGTYHRHPDCLEECWPGYEGHRSLRDQRSLLRRCQNCRAGLGPLLRQDQHRWVRNFRLYPDPALSLNILAF